MPGVPLEVKVLVAVPVTWMVDCVTEMFPMPLAVIKTGRPTRALDSQPTEIDFNIRMITGRVNHRAHPSTG